MSHLVVSSDNKGLINCLNLSSKSNPRPKALTSCEAKNIFGLSNEPTMIFDSRKCNLWLISNCMVTDAVAVKHKKLHCGNRHQI